MNCKEMTVKQLKDECREKGLKVSGTKKELLKRLENPSTKDVITSKNSDYAIIGLGWGDDRKTLVGNLIQKGLASFRYYSCDMFYYEVHKEKWTEILQK